LGRISEPEARKISRILGIQTDLFFESLTSCIMSGNTSTEGDAMSQPNHFPRSAGASPSTGRVVAQRINGKLPHSPNPTDLDERMTLDGIRATWAVMRDMSSARPGSIVERAGLGLIDSIWKAHSTASETRETAAHEFKDFTDRLTSGESMPPALAVIPSAAPPATPDNPIASGLQALFEPPAPATLGVPAIPPASMHASASSARSVANVPAAASGQTEIDGDPNLPFSVAAQRYLEARRRQNSNLHESSITYPCDIWVELMGDRPMGEYRGGDLQRFVNEAAFLPPNATKIPELSGCSLRAIIEKNRNGFPYGALGEITLRDGWLAALKGVFAEHLNASDHGSPFSGRKIRFPNHLIPGSVHAAPPVEITNFLFRQTIEAGAFEDAILSLLARSTGRRLGLLCFLRGSDLQRDLKGMITFAPKTLVTTPAGVRVTPYKTKESTLPFIVPHYVLETGFLWWAERRGERFLFEGLLGAKDPADTASKRLARWIDRAADELRLPRDQAGVPHGWRRDTHDDMVDAKISDGAARKQVGHAPADIHEKYKSANLRPVQKLELFDTPVPEGLDLSPFHDLDWRQV
jgi:hypothetical protein